jgi:hypothetical protein
MSKNEQVQAAIAEFPGHDGVRELLEEFGAEAAKLELELLKVGTERSGDRLVTIALALRMAHDRGVVGAIRRGG